MPTPAPSPPPRTARAAFAATLRHWRTVRNLARWQLAAATNYSEATITAVERQTRWPTALLAAQCDAALHTDGALSAIWSQVQAEHAAHRRRSQRRHRRARPPLPPGPTHPGNGGQFPPHRPPAAPRRSGHVAPSRRPVTSHPGRQHPATPRRFPVST